MNGLYLTGEAVPFTRLIRVTPQPRVRKIITELLDGTDHIQTIGLPTTRLIIEIQVDNAGRLILEDLDATVTPFTVKCDEGIYTGRIIELGQFTKPIKGHYRTTLTVAV